MREELDVVSVAKVPGFRERELVANPLRRFHERIARRFHDKSMTTGRRNFHIRQFSPRGS